MNDRWEYLRLVWEYRRNRVGDGRKASGKSRTRWSYDSVFLIWRPGAFEPQRGSQASSPEPDPVPDGAVVTALLNTIGSEGWELVAHVTMESPIVPTENHGEAPETGIALSQEWTFKRPAGPLSH